MSDPFLENCGGWTPAPDELARKYGFETAYLWGKLRRFCQLGGGTYTASHETIAHRVGMSRRNLIDRLNPLIKDGYVEDLDQGVKNRAHTYSVKKGEAKILSGMQISHTDNDIPTEADNVPVLDTELGMRNLHTNGNESAEFAQPDGLGMQKLHTSSAKNAHQAMQNLHLKRDLKKETKETIESPPPYRLLFLAISELCRINLKAATQKQIGQLDTSSKALSKLVIDPGQLKDKFPVYWAQVDWRGQKGQAPTPPQVQEVYGDYCHWLESGPRQNGTPANKSSPALSTEQKRALEQHKAQDAKEVYDPRL